MLPGAQQLNYEPYASYSDWLISKVTRNRILVAVWALAYEVYHISMVSDAYWDEQARIMQEHLHINTNRPDLDMWYRQNANWHTGMWVNNHPELDKLHKLFHRLNKK